MLLALSADPHRYNHAHALVMSGLNAPTSNFVVLAVPTPVFVSCEDSMVYTVSATGHLEPCLPVGTPHPLTVWFDS